MRSLSGAEKDTAGPCAPSRRVVSYMTIFLADIKKPPDLLGGRSTDISGARYVGGPPRLISMAMPRWLRILPRRLGHRRAAAYGFGPQISADPLVRREQRACCLRAIPTSSAAAP